MAGQYNLGTNHLNSANLDKSYLLFKSWVSPGVDCEFFAPLSDVLKKNDIPNDAQLIGVRIPYTTDDNMAVTAAEASDSMFGHTDFILQWHRESNLLYRIDKILEASVVNDKQRKAISELIVSEFYHMQSEYYRDIKHS